LYLYVYYTNTIILSLLIDKINIQLNRLQTTQIYLFKLIHCEQTTQFTMWLSLYCRYRNLYHYYYYYYMVDTRGHYIL